MENFKRLYNSLLSFHLNAVEHDNETYLVIRDSLFVEGAPSPDFYKILDSANSELFDLALTDARQKVNYLKQSLSRLCDIKADYQRDSDFIFDFFEVCNNNLIKVKCPDLFNKTEGKKTILINTLTITPNFIDDLTEEIVSRNKIISLLQHQLFDDVAIDNEISGTDRLWRAIEQNLYPGELSIAAWEEICSADNIYEIPFQGDSTNLVRITSDNPELHFDYYLTEKGKKVFAKLRSKYLDAKVSIIANMYLACIELELIDKSKLEKENNLVHDNLMIAINNAFSGAKKTPYLANSINHTVKSDTVPAKVNTELQEIKSIIESE